MNDPQGRAFNPQGLEVIISKIRLGIAVYDENGDTQSITQIREVVGDALGKIDWSEYQSDSNKIDQNLPLIREMFESHDSFE